MATAYLELQIVPARAMTPRELLDIMERSAIGGWRRGDFLHAIDPSRPIDAVWRDTDAFYVENGDSMDMVVLLVREDDLTLGDVLRSTSDLTVVEYNEIVERFRRQVVAPAAIKAHATVHAVRADLSLLHYLSDESFSKLREFDSNAVKTSSALQPQDRERWIAFLTSSFRAESELSPALLKAWLADKGGWPLEIASALASEFAFSRRILTEYAKEAAK